MLIKSVFGLLIISLYLSAMTGRNVLIKGEYRCWIICNLLFVSKVIPTMSVILDIDIKVRLIRIILLIKSDIFSAVTGIMNSAFGGALFAQPSLSIFPLLCCLSFSPSLSLSV